ncbi:MAG: C-GCAxxG-C-C family protein, partial [Acutalibacteraceae bacterium]|nr:C-GCAxxG-C-C family protein [Acutalibacteraceae bacterium]
MSQRTDKAVELFKNGFNCSQAVFAAFAGEFGMDEETALKVSAGLGGGVGRSREVCGAVSGAAMLVGFK